MRRTMISIQTHAHCSLRKAHCLASLIFMTRNIKVHLTPADVIRSHHDLHSVYKPTAEECGGSGRVSMDVVCVYVIAMRYLSASGLT
jgi:hypothetical protein